MLPSLRFTRADRVQPCIPPDACTHLCALEAANLPSRLTSSKGTHYPDSIPEHMFLSTPPWEDFCVPRAKNLTKSHHPLEELGGDFLILDCGFGITDWEIRSRGILDAARIHVTPGTPTDTRNMLKHVGLPRNSERHSDSPTAASHPPRPSPISLSRHREGGLNHSSRPIAGRIFQPSIILADQPSSPWRSPRGARLPPEVGLLSHSQTTSSHPNTLPNTSKKSNFSPLAACPPINGLPIRFTQIFPLRALALTCKGGFEPPPLR